MKTLSHSLRVVAENFSFFMFWWVKIGTISICKGTYLLFAKIVARPAFYCYFAILMFLFCPFLLSKTNHSSVSEKLKKISHECQSFRQDRNTRQWTSEHKTKDMGQRNVCLFFIVDAIFKDTSERNLVLDLFWPN